MRRLRWLIIAAFLFILAFVASSYYKGGARNDQPVKPAVNMRPGTDLQAQKWSITKTEGGREKVRIKAQNFRQNKDSGKLDLEGVELEVPHKTGKQFDRITTATAVYDSAAESLFADGAVEIILAVPEGQQPNGHLLHIKTSGVTFLKEGKVVTDKPVEFEFDRGNGKGVGAEYDTESRELILRDQVDINWLGANHNAPPMHIQSGYALYKERDAVIYLQPWAKLNRDTLAMEAGPATLKLKQGRIDTVETTDAKGTKTDPTRKLDYQAKQLNMKLTPKGQVTSMVAERDAVLVSTSITTRTQVNSDKIDMAFDPGDKDTTLTKAIATGHTEVESKPVPRPKVDLADTRILKSDTVEMTMKEGGQDIDNVVTRSAGTFEIVPNRPTQTHRWITGDQFWIQYGDDNQIQSFKTVNATTRSLSPPKPAKPGQKKAPDNPPALTSSKNLKAEFDPKTSNLSRLDQDQDFKYEAGDRKALSQRAQLDQTKDLITLTGAARVWDGTGSTNADTIVLNQKSGEFQAEGNVNSTRLPDKKGNSSALSNNDEPTQAKGQKMSSRDNNRQVTYEGNAIAWQGANRISADRIDIDRENGILRATGNVNSQFVDKSEEETKPDDPKAPAKKDTKKKTADSKKSKSTSTKKASDAPPKPRTASVYTVVKAPEMVYTEDNRLAYYKGGVVLTRPGLTVKGQELRAFLNDSEDDSSLDRAITDGGVEITQVILKRTRVGTAEHSEYYTADDKISLEGGHPKFVDSLKGKTEGRHLVYFTSNELMIVDDGESKQRSVSVMIKQPKKQ
ncbi:MAG TPA: LPS export ABC transporter periplasmic protein LptC [Bryobacteraceae bacterium]